MPRNALAILAVAGLVVFGAVDVAAGERWRRPVPGGAVVGAFSFSRATPYEPGRRRGVDISARPGARVLAPCSGVVTHAGRVPERKLGVSVRCGEIVATQLGLGVVAVTRGEHVLRGAAVGRLSARGRLRLGARVATDRHGYVDPLALMEGPSVAPPSVVPTAPTLPRAQRPTPRAAPAAPASPTLRWPVVCGLALLAAGALGGTAGVHRRRRRARRRRAIALAAPGRR